MRTTVTCGLSTVRVDGTPARPMLPSATTPAQKPAYTSPYHVFCREQRPLLPAGLKNAGREKAMGQMWKELTQAERAAYQQGLTQLASSGRGGLRAWAPALPTKLPAPPSAVVSAKFLAGCKVALSRYSDPVTIPVRASVVQLGGTYQTFVTQGGFRTSPPWCSRKALRAKHGKAALERLDATLPVQERATFWAAPERAAKTSPPSAAPEDQPAAKRMVCEVFGPLPPGGGANLTTLTHLYAHWSNQAPCALFHQGRQHAHSGAPPASVPAPLPAVEQAVAQQTGEEGGVGGGDASKGELERGRHAPPEGGYSDGELDRILQEQLARLRRSWSHERC